MATQRYIVAGPPASRTPVRANRSRKSARLRAYAARARSTCASSPHATTDARWTNSCGAVPTFGRYCRSAATSAGSPATKPERKPVIDERFDSVLKTTTSVEVVELQRGGGWRSNQSSL